ncbi:hypothetical protein ccbrp13_05510 [Ktedonobacteria bacterium brp13]|nr:hypothetical protein ccbrp13_05510 [Ktedonobacteria bacterium brp13]
MRGHNFWSQAMRGHSFRPQVMRGHNFRSQAFLISDNSITNSIDNARRVVADENKINFEKGLHVGKKNVEEGIAKAHRKFKENRNNGVSFKKAEEIRQADLDKVDNAYRQKLHNDAFEVLSGGGAESELAAYISGNKALKGINKYIEESAKSKLEKHQQELEKLKVDTAAIDKKSDADFKAMVRTDAEITASIQQDVQTTKAGVIYERFEQIQQGMLEDKDFATKVALAASDKFKQAKRWRTKKIINDSSARTNKQRHDRLKKDFKAVFRAAFRDNPDQPASTTEKDDIAKALNHPSVQITLREAQKDVPKDKDERKTREAMVKNAIQDAIFAGMSEKMIREETTRRFLKGTEGSVVAHDRVQKIEAENPSHYGETRLAAARASNIRELHNLKAVDTSGEGKIRDFQETHALQGTDAPDATHVQRYLNERKAPADMLAQKVDEMKAMDPATFAAFRHAYEDRAKPQAQEITNHKAAMDQINRDYNGQIKQAKNDVEQAIKNKETPAADIQAAKARHTSLVAERNNAISNLAERYPLAAFEHRKAVETENHQRASTLLDTHYKVKLEQAQQTSETVIDTARRTRDKEVERANRQHTLELDTISKDRRLSGSEKAEQRKKAKDKFAKTTAEIDERCKSAEIDARKKPADLIIERDTAKAELDRIYPLAAIDHKIADIKRFKKDMQTTIDKKAENDARRKKLQSDIESFKARIAAKKANWGPKREKAWYLYKEQQEKTSAAKEEYEVAHAESNHYERLWKKSCAEFDIIEKGITINNEKVYHIREEQNQLREEQNQLREELKTSSASTNADAIAAIQTKTDAIQTKTNDIAAIQTQTKDLIERKADVVSDIKKYQDEFHKHEEISKQKKRTLSQEESALATSKNDYEMTKDRYDSEEQKRETHEDNLRAREKQQETFRMLREIQRSNNRAMIWSQALQQSFSAIQAHAIGGLQAMLAALQK